MWAETTTKKFSSTYSGQHSARLVSSQFSASLYNLDDFELLGKSPRFTVDFKFPSFKRLFLEEEEQEEGRRRRRGRRGRRGRVEVPGNNATMVVVWE
ncbi:hypothetical protein PGIGA_G00196050 [Pangasianodon gigas]|uniref:Uncharacterized protein n=1 Tax=Pangasianodon gigas TaxID=30993 RepID=A0ACC5XX50_PANGG|nr:hypothetical protein [Pangasianodon gigas]